MLTLAKFSFGVGDRFAHQASAQLRAFHEDIFCVNGDALAHRHRRRQRWHYGRLRAGVYARHLRG